MSIRFAHRRRRAGMYRHRAHELAERAKEIPGEDDRRHMLELAATYERTADSLAPAPPSTTAAAFSELAARHPR
jgi:hypothetical protein